MKFAILLLCLTSLPYIGAHADEVPTEQITHSVPAQLRLLGPGLMKRGSDDSLALACFDEACSSVRFVQFTDQKAKWIGAAFEHPSNDLEIERMRLQQYLLARVP